MVRRMVTVGVLGALLTAAPASALTLHASTQFNSATKAGTQTFSRAAHGACHVGGSSSTGVLTVTCTGGGNAVLTYRFSAPARVTGTPSCGVDSWVASAATCKAKVSGSTITVNVMVARHGTTRISSVSVVYYTTS